MAEYVCVLMGPKVSFWGDKNILAHLYEYTRKPVNCTLTKKKGNVNYLNFKNLHDLV